MSADPDELGAIVTAVRRMEAMLGQKTLDIPPREQEFRHVFRRSIVAADDLPAGTILKSEDLALKRPGGGIRPREMHSFLGRTLSLSLCKGEQLTWKMFE